VFIQKGFKKDGEVGGHTQGNETGHLGMIVTGLEFLFLAGEIKRATDQCLTEPVTELTEGDETTDLFNGHLFQDLIDDGEGDGAVIVHGLEDIELGEAFHEIALGQIDHNLDGGVADAQQITDDGTDGGTDVFVDPT